MHNLSIINHALGQPTYAETRRILREEVSEILRTRPDDIRQAVLDGGCWGLKRPTWSSVRDAMSVPTLCGILCGAIDFNALIDALSKPSAYCKPSARAKSGYDIGNHIAYDHDAVVAAAKSHTGEAPLTGKIKLSLSDVMAIIDYVVQTRMTALTIIKEAMVSLDYDTDIVNAACDALRLRGERSDKVTLNGLLQDAADVLIKTIEGEGEEAPEPVVSAPVSDITMPTDASKAKLIDLTLIDAGLPSLATIIKRIEDATARAVEAESRPSVAAMTAEPTPSGDIPRGNIKASKAYEVFGLKSASARELLDFDVPTWNWEFDHPHVPTADDNYIFRPFELFRVLYAIITNQRAYLHGHTGTGKTTLIEQVASRLHWPVMRVNFDSEITRMDLIGRDVLTSEDGASVSRFVDGILPQMMSGPYIGIFDEIDFVRPDVAYVMQRALEGNGLMLTEDGGRIVKPHRGFRMFATGNTVGQGDEFGMYQGARPQSMALLDRFTVWIKVDYMGASDRAKLLKATAPKLTSSVITQINKYIDEHLAAFTTSKVLQPISPRTFMAFATAAEMFTSMMPASKHKDAVTQAIETTILDRASQQDRVVLTGIAQRVFS